MASKHFKPLEGDYLRQRGREPGWRWQDQAAPARLVREAGPALREGAPPQSGRRRGRTRHAVGGQGNADAGGPPREAFYPPSPPDQHCDLTRTGWGDADAECAHAGYSDGPAHRIYLWIGRRAAEREEGGPAGFLAGFSLPRRRGPQERGLEGGDQRF